MATVSLCMIVKNEEEVLKRCLESAKGIADEIIIVDTGSTDSTCEIALSMGANLYCFPWTDSFADARNFAFSKAICEYQLWLDADDVIEEESREKLIAMKKNLTADVVMLPYHTAFDEEGKPVFTFWRERFLKRSMDFKWVGDVHECIVPKGVVLRINVPVCHRKIKNSDSLRNLCIYQKLRAEGKELTTRDLYYYARELAGNRAWKAAVSIFEEFLSCSDAWSADCIEACLTMGHCYNMMGDSEGERAAVLRGFCYGTAPELCAAMGDISVRNGDYESGVFWYRGGYFSGGRSRCEGVFERPQYKKLIPALGLCLCYDRLGNMEEAYHWHRVAYEENPSHPSCRFNEEYFESKGIISREKE